jgi:hypothetical protein
MNTLPGNHYCKEHQGNTSDPINCDLCKAHKRIAVLELQKDIYETALIKAQHYTMYEAICESCDKVHHAVTCALDKVMK